MHLSCQLIWCVFILWSFFVIAALQTSYILVLLRSELQVPHWIWSSNWSKIIMKGYWELLYFLLEQLGFSKDFLCDYISFRIKSYYCRSLYYSEVDFSIEMQLNASLILNEMIICFDLATKNYNILHVLISL